MQELSLLATIASPADLRALPVEALPRLAAEMRQRLMHVVDKRGGHLASNLGVVELTIALHRSFDFLRDRLIWDTSHQSYGHKLLTGRNHLIENLRQYQGCCGFASKSESPFDLFDAGHAGTSISAALGIAVAEERLQRDSHTVAVIGDAAVAAGMPFEAMNHGGDLKQNLLVILNDNRMSIDHSVGGLSRYLNRLRSGAFYRALKRDIQVLLPRIPVVGRPLEEGLEHLHEVLRKPLVPGQFFEELGFKYFGPMDGHDVAELLGFLAHARCMKGPILLHVLTNKGHGFEPAQKDPIKYHALRGFLQKATEPEEVVRAQVVAKRSYTEEFADALIEVAGEDPLVHAVTAAMPGGTGLGAFQKRFPDRYYDVGIAEQHGTCFSSGMAFAGLKPVFAVYSTFLQRGFDQVVHDVCLQQNRVVFCLDRAGIVEDGPTHHGVFDIAYLRGIPEMSLAAPGDGEELREMLRLALERDRAAAIRYPKAALPDLARRAPRQRVEWGKGEVLREPAEITILAYGAMVQIAVAAADLVEAEGLPIGVVNMRFAKPLDGQLLRSIEAPRRTLITLEEHVVHGGFGSAVLEEIHAQELEFARILLWGVPDRFVQFGARDLLLEELGLDRQSIAKRVRAIAGASSRHRTGVTLAGGAARPRAL
ncbi:MAG: 1-deoxy-D-xylulose-5-phosphate synthase [Planctomycetes bacterium]|nr:1-deoxy-D-xylulose-5-phosphate synthase [Planctomycetota bacterium]